MGRLKEEEEEEEEMKEMKDCEEISFQGHHVSPDDNRASQLSYHSHSYHSHHSHRRGYRGGLWHVPPLRQAWVCLLWVLLAAPRNTCADSNGCDFFGSGLKQDGRGIQPVYLTCSSGKVEWQYPRAGLRVVLKTPNKGKDFRACIKGTENFEGARIYLEGHRSLLPLYSADDGRPRGLVRCFTSYKGEVALYVEAEQGSNGLKKQVAGFEYDLKPIQENAIYDPMEECRPCSDEEMLNLYCSGDFVAKGSILSVIDKPHLDLTSLAIRATKVFQQTYPVFGHGQSRRKDIERETQKKKNRKRRI